MQITKKERDYVVKIAQGSGAFPLRLTSLANMLGVREPTAFEMVEKLKWRGLVQAHGGMVSLTEEGRALYREIMMAHRTLETLMYRSGVDPDFACSECSKVDFLLDPQVIGRLYSWMGCPERCPHGKPVKVI